MARKAFEMMMDGLNDAIAYAEGDTTRGCVAAPIDVAAVRRRTGKTQAGFAKTYRVPIGTIRDWEQNRRQPDAPARSLLSIISADPAMVARLLAQDRT